MTDGACPERVPDRRRLGILLHPSSLPGPFAEGDLGTEARRFVDTLAACGVTLWQVLPLTPSSDRSPYNGRSAHAGDPRLISLSDLAEDGWVTPDELSRVQADAGSRTEVLDAASARFERQASASERAEFAAFCERNAYWLADYALYETLKTAHGQAPWWQWPKALRRREPSALAQSRARAGCDGVPFTQFLFFRQWQALRAYARERGVRFLGDMPLFLAADSADVWAHADLFTVSADGEPEIVTGVPPDYFSATGQRWGSPHYRWPRMGADGFAWWRERVRSQVALCDWLRIDHFRGLEAAWAIPGASVTGAHGAWMPVPGGELLSALQAEFGELPFVAEDLGIVTEGVTALRERFGLPGMRVLQFAFEGDADNVHLPHNYVPETVAYTGTHDNDTTRGWYEALSPGVRARVHDYLGAFTPDEGPWPMIRAVVASVARWAILPWQDALALPSGARMNTPGTTSGNWRFRFRWEDVPGDVPARLRRLAELYGRLPP